MAPISLISSPPIYMPLDRFEEFQASTPASGTFDHEPVLHHLEKGATVTVEPSVEGFDHVKNAIGDLYVTEAALCFLNPETGAGFSVPYPAITLHATSKQARPSTSSQQREQESASTAADNSDESNRQNQEEVACVYCQLDETEPEDWDNLPEDELPETKEMFIFTQDAGSVQQIYAALSRCATLHPSPETNAGPILDLDSLVTADNLDDAGEDAHLDAVEQDTHQPHSGVQTNGHAESTEAEAGRARQDYATPDARFAPY